VSPLTWHPVARVRCSTVRAIQEAEISSMPVVLFHVAEDVALPEVVAATAAAATATANARACLRVATMIDGVARVMECVCTVEAVVVHITVLPSVTRPVERASLRPASEGREQCRRHGDQFVHLSVPLSV
jgi:hypothetical protein